MSSDEACITASPYEFSGPSIQYVFFHDDDIKHIREWHEDFLCQGVHRKNPKNKVIQVKNLKTKKLFYQALMPIDDEFPYRDITEKVQPVLAMFREQVPVLITVQQCGSITFNVIVSRVETK